jgi:hypothetical protein
MPHLRESLLCLDQLRSLRAVGTVTQKALVDKTGYLRLHCRFERVHHAAVGVLTFLVLLGSPNLLGFLKVELFNDEFALLVFLILLESLDLKQIRFVKLHWFASLT